jgi:hypothetical protein
VYRVFVVRWIPFLAIALLLVWALLAAVPYGASYVTLRGLSRAQRGEAAADETRSFLTRAGRVDLRRRLQERDEWQKRRPSAPANAWRWGYEESLRLPPDAKIYLNDPRVALYFYGTFFWYPARLDATPEPEVITGHASLARHARPIAGRDFSELARRGYTHVVIRAHERFEIVDLEAAEEP